VQGHEGFRCVSFGSFQGEEREAKIDVFEDYVFEEFEIDQEWSGIC
ncbi:hypothetical protein Tco_1174757, partial [Tanacetum coccineum]